MKNLFLAEQTNDLELTIGKNLRMTSTYTEFLSAKISSRLQTYLGEWFLNKDLGVPYFTDILKKRPDLNNVRAILLTETATTEGVKEVLEFEIDFDEGSRILNSVVFSVLSDEGRIVGGVI